MSLFDWLREQLFGSVPKEAVPDRSVAKDGRTPTGYWTAGPEEDELSEAQADEEYKRKYVYPNMTLYELLDLFSDDLAAALDAKGLHVSQDQQGNVTVISDAMMKGNLKNDEFPLLARLKYLRRLILRGSRLTDEGFAALAEMPQLEDLLIENNSWGSFPITDEGLQHLAHLPKLKEFSLDGGVACGVGLKHIVNPECIERLGFDKTPITDEGLAVISRFPNLKRLQLWRRVDISDEGLRQLQRCTRLEEVDLALCECQSITDVGVGYLAELPELASISLGDTNVTDACVDALLRLSKLEAVGFGYEKVTLQAVQRLEAAGVDVDFDALKEHRRETNLLRYQDVDFAIDQDQSSLRAYVNPARDDVTWELEIECLDEYVPSHMSPASLEGPPLHFRGTWRELEGEEFRLGFDEKQLHPILPGNPGNIYIGWHACPNDHVIRFLKRNGRAFLIDWTCVAKESERDDGSDIWVSGEIPFTEVVVWSDKALSVPDAKLLASRYFDLHDLGEPEVSSGEFDTRYRFPVTARH